MLSNHLASRLKHFDINDSVLADYQILCLPENFFSDEMEELYDADDSISLSKMLKGKNIKCANSYDLGLESDFYIRKSADVFFGILYVLEKAVIPFLASTLSAMLALNVNNSLGKKKRKEW